MSQVIDKKTDKKEFKEKWPEITYYGDIDFSMPNIESLLTYYGIWEGLTNFRGKSGPLYPKHLIKREHRYYFANCIKFNDSYNSNGYTPEKYLEMTIESPYLYGKGLIFIELLKLLELETGNQPIDCKIELNKRYLVNCEQYSGTVVVKNFVDCPYYVFKQNNGKHIVMAWDHMKQLNDKEKRYLGV